MSKHTVRCTLCNKFITFTDALDDGMCETCAERVERAAFERARPVRITLCVILLLWIVFVLFLLTRSANAFNVEYFVTGMNLTTNEHIVGWLDGKLGESDVSGYVLDRGNHYAVVGLANGIGSFELRSLCCLYDVVVTDEVSASKIENRKNAER